MEKILTNDLNEVFVFPVGLEPVVYIDNHPLYGSNALNEKFISVLEEDSRITNVNKFEKLVKEKRIVPCYVSKGLFNFFLWRTFAPMDQKGIMAFYEPKKSKRIYLILSNQVNIFGYASSRVISEIIVHECMHMSADQKTNNFLNLFTQELIDYYKVYFSKVFNLDKKNIKNEAIHNILKFVFNTFERNSEKFTNTELIKYFKMIETELKPYSKMKDKEFTETLNFFIVTIKIAFGQFEKFYYNYRKFFKIIAPLYMSYKEAFNMKNLTTMCYQELIYPSEVIAIWSERNMKKPLQAVNML